MDQTFPVNQNLTIDLLPSIDDATEPVLCLSIPNEAQQSIVISLSEIFLLRDVLAVAGAQLAEMEAAARIKRKAADQATLQ